MDHGESKETVNFIQEIINQDKKRINIMEGFIFGFLRNLMDTCISVMPSLSA